MTRLLTAMEMNLRDIGRRRGVLGLLFIIPMVFYLVRRGDANGQAIKFLLLGLGLTVSTASLFATVSAQSLDHRLRLSGYRMIDLYLGRLAALITLGLVIMVPYAAFITFDQRVERLGALVLAMGLTAMVAAPVGMLLGCLVPRELEGTLLLLIVIAIQFLLDPAKTAARAAPFWSAREIGTYAIDLTDSDYLHRGIAHAALYALTTLVITLTIAAVRLRDRRPKTIVRSTSAHLSHM